jgi:hypothetical protein
MGLCVETKLSNTGMHDLKNWEQKGSEKEQKTIGSKTMFVRIVTNCKKYNKVSVCLTLRLV